MTVEEMLQEIEERLKGTSPAPWQGFENGPWGGQGFGVQTLWNGKNQRAFTTHENDNSEESCNDSFFIAHSRTDVPRLVKALRVAIRKLSKSHSYDSHLVSPHAKHEDHCGACKAELEISKILTGDEKGEG